MDYNDNRECTYVISTINQVNTNNNRYVLYYKQVRVLKMFVFVVVLEKYDGQNLYNVVGEMGLFYVSKS